MLRQYARSLKTGRYEKYKVRIDQENEAAIALVLLCAGIVLAVFIVQAVMNRNSMAGYAIAFLFVYLAVGIPFYLGYLRKRECSYTLWLYVYETVLMMLTAISATIWQMRLSDSVFLFLMLALPMQILDRPVRICGMIAAMLVFYGILDGVSVDAVTFHQDLLSMICAGVLSCVVSIYTLSVRLQSIDYTGYYAEKADKDPLTGLYNRFGAERHIDLNKPGILVYMDLDHFKEINDSYGHETGDRVLVAAADVLRACFRKDDILIRMGGDEFAVFARGTWQKEDIEEKMEKLRSSIDEIHTRNDAGSEISITTSIGCAYAPRGCLNLDQLIHAADAEMYSVKESGRNSFRITVI